MIAQMVQIKVASLQEFDLQVEFIEDFLLLSDIETRKWLEKWAFGEFGIGRVFGLSAVGIKVRVLGEEFSSDWAFIDSGWLVGHEEVEFLEWVLDVFHWFEYKFKYKELRLYKILYSSSKVFI